MEEDGKFFESIPNRLNLQNEVHLKDMYPLRLELLSKAQDHSLFAESFKTLEDLHFILNRMTQIYRKGGGGKTPIPSEVRIQYYENLSQILWRSNANLHHAFAVYEKYNIIDRRTATYENKNTFVSQVMIALLAVPLHKTHDISHSFCKIYRH